MSAINIVLGWRARPIKMQTSLPDDADATTNSSTPPAYGFPRGCPIILLSCRCNGHRNPAGWKYLLKSHGHRTTDINHAARVHHTQRCQVQFAENEHYSPAPHFLDNFCLKPSFLVAGHFIREIFMLPNDSQQNQQDGGKLPE